MTGTPSLEDIQEAVRRALRVARIVDPDDGTVPFFLVDGTMVWVRPKQAVETIAHAVLHLWIQGSESGACYGVTDNDQTGDTS